MEGTKRTEKARIESHCCECWIRDAEYAVQENRQQQEHGDFANLLSAAGQLLTAEYRNAGDRPTAACDAADSFLRKVFQVAETAMGGKNLVIPDSWTLGGKSRG